MTSRILILSACLFLLISIPAAFAAGQGGLLPYLGCVTETSAALNILPESDGSRYFAAFRMEEDGRSDSWRRTQTQTAVLKRPIQWLLDGLLPGKQYRYVLWSRSMDADDFREAETHAFRTQPSAADSFAFALFSDAHITPGQFQRMEMLRRISEHINGRRPDFVAMLGDNIQTFDAHGGPMEDPAYGPLLYRMLRHSLGSLPAERACYFVNGNWEGENGWHPPIMRSWAEDARKQFIPNPISTTYPQGGSDGGDYYAFSWGDLLCIVLNVTGYTPVNHGLGSSIGRRDDWTLGKAQRTWLLQTLQTSREPLKIILMHHPVGGGSPDDMNARYGRGGGRGARVGEQAELHRWMRTYGVQALFYGHDHVFTDTVVDGIHYVCVGSAGAPWKFGERETGYDRYWPSSGYSWLERKAEGLAVSFVAADGEVLHRFIIRE